VKTTVAVTASAVWTPDGVWLNALPPVGPSKGQLAAWAGATPLGAIHPRARRPHRQAEKLVQLAHALLEARAARHVAPPPPAADIDFLLGTALGSAEADVDFVRGLAARGSGLGSPGDFVYTLPTSAPAEVALALGLGGALSTFAAGSISGLFAVARAATHVGQGRSAACLCGGVEMGRSSSEGGEIAALFLLEAGSPLGNGPHLSEAAVGFASLPGLPPLESPLDTLLSLASACAGTGQDLAVAGRSEEGYWARLRVEGGTGP